MKKCFLITVLAIAAALVQGQDNPGLASDFFPIAVWAQNPANAAAYKENGINLFVGIPRGLNEENLDYLRKADMKVIAHQNDFGLAHLQEGLIYGWMHGDEPDNAQRSKTGKGWDPCRDPEVIITDYEKIKQNDPSRPVYLNVGRGVAYTNWVGRGACRGKTDMYKVSENGYLKGADIVSFDIYPVNSGEADARGQLWYVAKGIDNLQAWTGYRKPAWCWIETTQISAKAERKPTPAEVRSEVWMALIHGAKGIGYFCHSFGDKTDDAALLHDPEMIRGVKAINAEVTSLARVLNSPDTSGYATVECDDPTIPVDVLTKEDGKSSYIFAIGMREGATTATFTVKHGKKVEVIGENRTIRIKNHRFTDAFSSYGVHLYRVRG
ncbi:MAG TPA: hypothetical protein VF490_14005 [Chryseosolibacter sp.]